jgi:hypothetical protein
MELNALVTIAILNAKDAFDVAIPTLHCPSYRLGFARL